MTPAPAPQRQLLLAGGGHSHALVLKRWVMHPQHRPKVCRITLVSRASTALYSGMVPGLVAGLYLREACAIDLRRLCRLAGVSFVRAEILGLELEQRELVLEGRPPLRWDLLSLDLGAETAAVGAGEIAVKPLEPFLDWCAGLGTGASGEAAELRILGGGAAAVELALALQRRVRPRLMLRGEGLHLGSRAANACGERLLGRAGILVERHAEAPEAVGAAAGAEPALACTGSRAPGWLAASGLAADPATGRLLTETSLQVVGHPAVFASGDCALISDAPRPPRGSGRCERLRCWPPTWSAGWHSRHAHCAAGAPNAGPCSYSAMAGRFRINPRHWPSGVPSPWGPRPCSGAGRSRSTGASWRASRPWGR
ncbi:hypothetical protein [Cyanobium sp. ATX-6F1]|uniref:hypothetical protein n=1 Tax=Cyanobium sp. ATX-6F1 TaxID=3137388 RepID=UPI0039BEC20E